MLDGLNILLVEDDVLILLDLKASLENAGAHVTTASSLRDALKYCEADYAAAILDIRLPDGEVFPAAERLAQARIPIIFHSGNAGCDSARARFPDAAALSKPVQEQVLIATVQQKAKSTARIN
ncbi:response regulator [Yoonia sp. BS5-3]|uniref:Response regulator n=1 Tax=Yoonia phaeophyticola TaxID=3137369 RepID=A0ABZ2V7N1_9RHOB